MRPKVSLQTFILKKHLGTLSEAQSDFYHLVYLLDAPTPGEIFNESWNTLHLLAKKSKRRDKVISEFQQLDLLADSSIGSLTDPVKAKVIATEFSKSFPEYLDYYLRRCLAFYRGDEKFPNGNPTPKCRTIIDNQSPLLNSSLVIEIKSAFAELVEKTAGITPIGFRNCAALLIFSSAVSERAVAAETRSHCV